MRWVSSIAYMLDSASPDNLKIGHGRPQSLPPIINAQRISKAFGAKPLFQDISFTVSEGDRIGLIGPNGSGKSTLLHILIGRVPPDSGEIAVRKLARLSYVAQESQFAEGESVRSIIDRALAAAGVPHAEW